MVTTTLQPLSRLTGAFDTNGNWAARFFSHSNWLYTLERMTNFGSWTSVSATLRGTEGEMVLQDTNPPPTRAFYRVRGE